MTTPLPLSLAGYAPTEATHRALNAIVEEYGKQCREAALEEAASLVEKYFDKYFDVNEPWMNPQDIRDLK